MMLRYIFATLFISFIFASPADAQEKITIAQFGKEKFLLYLPLYTAMEEGLFAKRGIDVELKFAGNDDQIFATVIGGSADFGVGDPVFVAIAKEKGGPGKVVAMMITKLGLSGYAAKPDAAPIEDPAQLNGQRISSFPEPSTTYTLLSELKKNHAPSLQIVQAAFGAQLATLEAGQVDIAVDIEPGVSVAEDKGYKVVFDLEKYTEPQAITGIMTLDSTIEKRPETVQKTVSAIEEAVVLLHKDKDVALRVAKKIYPNLSDKVLQAAITRIMDKNIYPDTVVVKDEYWQRSLRTRRESGDLKNEQATETAVDNSFAMKAMEEIAR